MKSKQLLSVALVAIAMMSNAQAQNWNQRGSDLDGEAASDRSGWSVSMPDRNTLAIGADWNSGNGANSGHVRIYSWSGTAWVQKGSDINGEGSANHSGISVSMPDSNTVAIGAPNNNGNSFAGHARIYTWNGSGWIQKGQDIDGEFTGDQFGYSVNMPDSNTVAIGAPTNNGNGNDAGHVRIYSWNTGSGNWVQKGADLDGEAAGDESGCTVSMPDSNTIAIGAHFNDGSGTGAGHVRIYTWNGSAWTQKGLDIDGEGANDQSGISLSMPDTNALAIGAYLNDGITGTNSGHVRIYSWDVALASWVQKGGDLDGENAGDGSGWFTSMPDANTVAIGAPTNDQLVSEEGHARIYSWSSASSAWVQKGADIDGEAAFDRSGSVCMPDTNTIAIGAYFNDGNGADAGHARVYEWTTASMVKGHFEMKTVAFPNPTTGKIDVELGSMNKGLDVIVKNVLGQDVSRTFFSRPTSRLSIDIPGEAGVYFVEVTSGDSRGVIKVVKK